METTVKRKTIASKVITVQIEQHVLMVMTLIHADVSQVTLATSARREIIIFIPITVQMEPCVLMVMIPTHVTVPLVTLESIVRMKTTASLEITVQMEPNVLSEKKITFAVSLILMQGIMCTYHTSPRFSAFICIFSSL